MPNWCEGTLKIRGDKQEDVVNCLKSMLGNNFKIDVSDDGFEVLARSHINGTRRAFIDKQSDYLNFDDLGRCRVELIGFSQAWDINPEEYIDFATKNNVDIEIFGFECGMRFVQGVEILRDGTVENVVDEKVDYFWDVPFSSLGG